MKDRFRRQPTQLHFNQTDRMMVLEISACTDLVLGSRYGCTAVIMCRVDCYKAAICCYGNGTVMGTQAELGNASRLAESNVQLVLCAALGISPSVVLV